MQQNFLKFYLHHVFLHVMRDNMLIQRKKNLQLNVHIQEILNQN
jgi:hypothetical protein